MIIYRLFIEQAHVLSTMSKTTCNQWVILGKMYAVDASCVAITLV